MKSLGTPRPWPPEMCEELRQHLGRYSWSRKPETVVDDLFALLDELDGWLKDARPYGKRMARVDEWASIVEDVEIAYALVGSNLTAQLPSASTLLAGLDTDLGLNVARRKALVPVLKQVVAELEDSASAGAAFLDLVDAVKDPATRTEVIEGKVDVLDSVLRFGGRSLGSVSANLCSIVDNHAWTINALLTELEGVEMLEPNHYDADAGMTEDERVSLAKRWAEHVPTPRHHVVWVFYRYARGLGWRFQIGSCEFFEGPALMAALAEVDEVREAGGEYPGNRDPFNRPPDELIGDSDAGRFLRKDLRWPSGDNWVAVRVDLGVGTFPDLEETARDQVRAQVALAAFDIGRTSWTELTGYQAFVDGLDGASSMPYEEPGSVLKYPGADHTADWLHDNRAGLGAHLATGPQANAVVAAASTLARTNDATPSIVLLEAVRVIETQRSVLQVPHWQELVREFATTASALFRAQVGAVKAIEGVAHDLRLREHLPELERIPQEFNIYEGRRRSTNMATAVEKLPNIVAKVPEYNRHSRRLRETATDLATPANIEGYVAAQTAHDDRLLRRVHRVRNSLTHGGPVNNSIVAGSAKYIVAPAKHITSVTLRALLDGKAPIETLRDYRNDNTRWTKQLAKATTVAEALFPGMDEDSQPA